MDRFDPQQPPAETDVDIEADTIDVDSSGVDLSYARENEDGSPTARALADQQARTATRETSITPPAAEKPGESAESEDGEADTDLDSAAEQRARDERGRFAKEGERKPDRFERRIQRKRDEINTVTRELSQKRAELERIQRDIAAAATANGQAQKPTPETAAQAKAELGPKPQWKDFEAQGKDYAEYEEARDAWLLKQAEANVLAQIEARTKDEKAAAEKETAAAKAKEAVQAREQKIADARKRYTDFDAVIKAADDAGLEYHDFIGLFQNKSEKGFDVLYELSKPQHYDALDVINDFFDSVEPETTFPLMDALLASEDPARLLLALADDQLRGEIESALRLDGRVALVRLGQIDERLSARATGSQRKPAPGSTAAPPPSHRAGSHSAGASRASSADSESVDDYVARRQRESFEARKRPA